MGWSYIHVWWIKIQEGYLGHGEVPAPGQNPQPNVPVLGRLSPHNSGCKTQWGLNWRKKLLESQAVLKNPHMDLLRLTSSELQHRGSGLKGTSGIQGET